MIGGHTTLGEYREMITRQLQHCGLPRHMWTEITEYILVGRPTGDFLLYVLRNDLRNAIAKADDLSAQCLKWWVRFLDSHAPAGCSGSPAAVRDWMKSGGIVGKNAMSNTTPPMGPDSVE